jgi:hypothetical protein
MANQQAAITEQEGRIGKICTISADHRRLSTYNSRWRSPRSSVATEEIGLPPFLRVVGFASLGKP